jgi:ATP-dependent RNA helicase DeaD
LVATDVAARGLDIDDIDVIIQYGVRHVDSFVHRTGRTGRAGKEGMNVIFVSKTELPFVKKCEESLNMTIEYKNRVTSEAEDKIDLNHDIKGLIHGSKTQRY